MIRLLLAIAAWRLVRRLAVPAIVTMLVMVTLDVSSPARHRRRHTAGAITRVIQPIEQDLRRALREEFRR